MGSGNSLGPCILSLMPKYGGNILPDKYLNNPHGIRNGGKRKFLKAKLEEQSGSLLRFQRRRGWIPRLAVVLQSGVCQVELTGRVEAVGGREERLGAGEEFSQRKGDLLTHEFIILHTRQHRSSSPLTQ